MRPLNLALAGTLAAIAVCSTSASAQQMTQGRIYAFTSSAQGACPSLHWHLVVQGTDKLAGMISWNDMKSVAKVNGTFSMRDKTFQAKAEEVGGQARTANVTGSIRDDGWLVASIVGPDVNCPKLNIPWFEPPPPSAG